MRQQWLVFLPMTLATAGLAACASVLGGDEVKVRPIDTLATMGAPQRDALYESAVAAINERDYGRALDYLQAAKSKDPRNVKALNALGVVYDKLGRFDLSARYYAQARAIEPDSKIVAENMGYSRILQRLLDPNQPVAVATIDLPPDLIKSASSATPSPAAEKAAVAAAAVPAMPVAERKVIDTKPHVETAMPFALPDAKPLLASIVLPEPVMPVIEKKVIDAPPPSLAAAQFVLPDTRSVFASVFYSDPVVTERKVIDAPHSAVMTTPLRLSQEKPFFATAILPEPVLPVMERRVIDASSRTPAPFVLPDVKPLFVASLSVPVVVENRAPPESAPSVVTIKAAEPARSVAASAGPVPPLVRARFVSAPTLATMPAAKLVPATLLSSLPAAEPVTEKKAAAVPAVTISTAPLPAKPVLVVPVTVASVPPAAVMPRTLEPKTVTAAVPAVTRSVSSSPAKPVAPISATRKKVVLPAVAAAPHPAKVALSPSPVMVARHAAPAIVASAPAKFHAPAPAMKQVANAVPAKMAPNTANRNGKILIGQPIRLFNASGKAGGTGTVLRRLTTLGWTMRPSEGRVQPVTALYYSAQNIAAAKALQRTLPFPVRLASDKAGSSGMRLVIGRDYLSWKPKNARMAALWQKGTIVASLQKPSIRGVR